MVRRNSNGPFLQVIELNYSLIAPLSKAHRIYQWRFIFLRECFSEVLGDIFGWVGCGTAGLHITVRQKSHRESRVYREGASRPVVTQRLE